ncbi:MAG: hypothetical protein KatS3mg129_2948 [Leptospiraceae bacterium]|nr:MAG: hypothetical protein KatS3mg129_2948 [Leptospiraceae bacterium]
MKEDFKNGISNFFNSFGIQIKQQSDKPLQTLFLFENQKLKNTSLTEESLKQKEWYNYINETYLFLWDDLPSLNTQIDDDYKGILVFAVELTEIPKKTHLKEIARLISRNYYGLPVLVFFKYQDFLSIVNCERTNYKRKDLQNKIRIGKVYLLYNINLLNPHTGHIRILEKFYNDDIKNFKYAYDNLQKVFEIDILIDNFIKDITEWYFYALDEIEFPNDLNIDEQAFKQMTLLRMISRIIFIWYLKEMKLIPEELFDTDFLKNIVKDFGKKNHYYNAILQNLFFATLNRPIKERAFAKDEGFPKNKNNYGVYNLYRYEDLFLIPPEEVIELFSTIPFLNGGLFECLDKIDNDNKIIYIDGFSRNIKKRAKVPDHIFFDEYGLIPILKKYIFTIEENTPLDVEVALDPELIGKVFENLLAYYLPESSEAARKETGSYYTPKQIVEYMVNESLKERIKICYKEQYNEELPEEKIELLFDPSIEYEDQIFTDKEKENLIRIINQLKILDPAVGSGAFLQGALQKMVFLLQRLDPDNKLWKKIIIEDVINKQIKILKEDKERIQQLNDDEIKQKALKLVDQKLKEIEESFNKDYFFDDYARKLYLIEQCLYGVDIQPIAIQLSKLRFFLTLVIDQKVIEDPEQNYGIRPLPNLETKLIAANTLIPLKQDHQNSLKNLEILKLEEELKEIREKYFNAVNRQHKINAIQKDKEIREKIKTILLNCGWDTEIAQKIVEFDPYDQHNVASWFDPEWMFGITDGFDIVIGNPPYMQYRKMIKYWKFCIENKIKIAVLDIFN